MSIPVLIERQPGTCGWSYTMTTSRVFLSLTLIILLPGLLCAYTLLEGEQTGTLRALFSPYEVTGDSVYVPRYNTLTIEPGVEIYFGADHGLWVDGTLIVAGEPGDSVLMHGMGAPVPGCWNGITINDNSSDNSIIECAVISYGEKNVYLNYTEATVRNSRIHSAEDNNIYMTYGAPIIENCVIADHITENVGSCVFSRGGTPTIDNCTITGGNSGSALIRIIDNSTPTITNNTLADGNDNCIELEDVYDALVDHNFIYSPELRGMYIDNADFATITYNTIDTPRGSGIFLTNSASVTMVHNTIYRAGANQVDLRDGIYFGTGCSSPNICGNIVMECTGYGVRSNVPATSAYGCYYDNDEGSYGGVLEGGDSDLLDTDPMLNIEQDPFSWNHLRPVYNSPCVDAAGCGGYTDEDGTPGDIGARFYNQNDPPVINSYVPENLDLTGYASGDSVTFSVSAQDPNENPLDYTWYFRGEEVGTNTSVRLELLYTDMGDSIWVEVDDGWYGGCVTLVWHIDEVATPEYAENTLPKAFAIESAYPNPFNPTTSIQVAVPEAGVLNLELYTVEGRRVWREMRDVPAGRVVVSINGENWAGGVYFLQANYRGQTDSRKLLLLK